MAFVLRLGSRPSRLALIQAELVKSALRSAAGDLQVEIVPIRTSGDRLAQWGSLKSPGNKRWFVAELEEALSAHQVDLNVHSMKDLPAVLDPRLRIVAVPRREDPRDALVARNGAGIDTLPVGARLGTSSTRRTFEVLRARADLRVGMLRGNVDTRLKRLESGEFDGVILALAGLKRLGHTELSGLSPLDEDRFVPAAGQGALALEALSDRLVGGSRELEALVAKLDDRAAAVETAAERAFLEAIGASCASPVGVLARMTEGAFSMRALLFSRNGERVMEDALSASAQQAQIDAGALGRELGQRMLKAGGRALLADG